MPARLPVFVADEDTDVVVVPEALGLTRRDQLVPYSHLTHCLEG
jgi:hypothetical protein